MSRSLDIRMVKVKRVGGNKCIPLMNFIQENGGREQAQVLTMADLPALRAIHASLTCKEDKQDLQDAIDLLEKYEELEFAITY